METERSFASVMEQCERQVEERIAETRGTFRTRDDLEGEGRRVLDTLEDTPSEVVTGLGLVPEKPAALRGLAGREFEALFASDAPRKKISFTVAGRPACVWLRRMGAEDYETLLTLMAPLAMEAKGGGALDMRKVAEMNRFLISRTVADASLPRKKPDNPEEWETVTLPPERERREEWLAEEFRTLPDVWEGLVQECMSFYGMGDQAGN